MRRMRLDVTLALAFESALALLAREDAVDLFPAHSGSGVGSATFRSAGCACGYGGGDCDSNTDCMPGLTCVVDVGPSYDMSTASDVCLPAACAGQVPKTASGCTAACPCGHGGGDCDSNADCMLGLTCVRNNGASFGMPADYDVCVQ